MARRGTQIIPEEAVQQVAYRWCRWGSKGLVPGAHGCRREYREDAQKAGRHQIFQA